MSKEHEKTSAADAAEPVVDRMASGAHGAIDRAAGLAAQASEAVDANGEELRALLAEWLDRSRVYVRDNPVKALGIAVVGGFFLSRLLSSR